MNPHEDRSKPEVLLAGTRPVSLSGAARTRILARARDTWNTGAAATEYRFPWRAFSAFALALILAFTVQAILYVPVDTYPVAAPTATRSPAVSPLAGIIHHSAHPLNADLLQARFHQMQELTEEAAPRPASSRSHRPNSGFSTV